jgi:hypothetical protein
LTSTPTCSAAWRRRVSAYHDGGLLGEERATVEAHIRSCATCQALLASYDHLYRDLRALPGFEGVLTITRPGSRRGLGATARPSLTYPGRSLPNLPARQRLSRAGGSSVIATLLVILGLIFIIGRENGFVGPETPPAPTAVGRPVAVLTPTFAPHFPNGAPCANQGATSPQPYSYSDTKGTIWLVNGCGNPTKMATLPFTDFDIGAWSPDDSQVLVFTPSLAHRSPNTPTRLYAVGQNGAVRQIAVTPPGVTTPYSADDAQWASTTSVIVRSQDRLVQVDMPAQTVTPLPMTATRIAWRANALYYSTVHQGRATLRRYDPFTKSDTAVLQLGAGQAACTTFRCWDTIPWDVTTDGLWVAYQYPPPTAVPTSASGGSAAQLVLQNIATGKRIMLAQLPITSAPIQIAIAPSDVYVAAIGIDPAQTSVLMVLSSISGRTPITFPQYGHITWRADGQAMVVTPLLASPSVAPLLVFTPDGTTTTLAPGTTNFAWQN